MRSLLSVAREGRLSDRRVLAAQTQRMIADPRSEALATRFAAQWLRLPDLDEIHPDTPIYPDFHEQLKHAMRRETELFFYNLVQNDRNVLDLFTAGLHVRQRTSGQALLESTASWAKSSSKWNTRKTPRDGGSSATAASWCRRPSLVGPLQSFGGSG